MKSLVNKLLGFHFFLIIIVADTSFAVKILDTSTFKLTVFLFFLLSNTEPSEKRFHMNSFVADFGRPLESDRVFSRQIPEESRSLFHFCINEVEHLDKAKQSQKCPGLESNIHFQEVPRSSGIFDEDLNCLTKFNIPNFVNTEQNSSLGDDDLLISEPPIFLESKSVMQSSHQNLDWKVFYFKVNIPAFLLLSSLKPFLALWCFDKRYCRPVCFIDRTQLIQEVKEWTFLSDAFCSLNLCPTLFLLPDFYSLFACFALCFEVTVYAQFLKDMIIFCRDCEGWSLAVGEIRRLLSQGKYKPQD